ncbi:MAG: helix-turn-helix transcriptional regulator [Deltaproteobacteria bacterium]|nr:helix-turn-helix transcriptional regulator [Deltaproteobacteria bacterium]
MNIPLKVALVERRIKQFDLSRLLGVDPAKVSKIVNGWISPNEEIKQNISRYLGKPIDELFPDSQEDNYIEPNTIHPDQI